MTAPAETTVNEDLLRRVLEHITAHPEEHNQQHWAVRTDCGAAYCLAGHAVVMSGYGPDWSTAFGASDTGVSTAGVAGRNLTIAELAADLLRLDPDDENEGDHELFDGRNTLDDLWRIAAELTNGRVSRTAQDATP